MYTPEPDVCHELLGNLQSPSLLHSVFICMQLCSAVSNACLLTLWALLCQLAEAPGDRMKHCVTKCLLC